LIEQTDSNACDLCGGTHFDVIRHTDRHSRLLTTGICTRCGLIAHLPVPNEDEVGECYATRYRQDYHGERTPSNRRVMRAWNNAARIPRQIGQHLAPGSPIIPEDQATQIRQAVGRYNALSYHLRPAYLGRQAKQLAGYAREYMVAPWFVRRLLARMRP
jgi:hypothetical protein